MNYFQPEKYPAIPHYENNKKRQLYHASDIDYLYPTEKRHKINPEYINRDQNQPQHQFETAPEN